MPRDDDGRPIPCIYPDTLSPSSGARTHHWSRVGLVSGPHSAPFHHLVEAVASLLFSCLENCRLSLAGVASSRSHCRVGLCGCDPFLFSHFFIFGPCKLVHGRARMHAYHAPQEPRPAARRVRLGGPRSFLNNLFKRNKNEIKQNTERMGRRRLKGPGWTRRQNDRHQRVVGKVKPQPTCERSQICRLRLSTAGPRRSSFLSLSLVPHFFLLFGMLLFNYSGPRAIDWHSLVHTGSLHACCTPNTSHASPTGDERLRPAAPAASRKR